MSTTLTTKLDELRLAAEHCLALGRRTLVPDLHHEVARRLHTLFVRIMACEAGGYTRAEIAAVVWPVRELVSASPLFRRLQTWPRGYQGDYETLEALCAERTGEPAGTLGHLFDTFLLRSPIAQQLRNRVAWQSGVLLDTLLAGRGTARVLSLGCGPALDVRAVAECVRLAPGQVTLHDADAAALAHVAGRLGEAAAGCRFVPGDALRAVGTLAEHGPYDLVLVGSLLDELPDKHAIALVHAVHAELLAPGGRTLLAAAGDANPYRPCLEYLTDWATVTRSERELVRIAQLAGAPAGSLALERDGTGLALLAELTRASRARVAA